MCRMLAYSFHLLCQRIQDDAFIIRSSRLLTSLPYLSNEFNTSVSIVDMCETNIEQVLVLWLDEKGEEICLNLPEGCRELCKTFSFHIFHKKACHS